MLSSLQRIGVLALLSLTYLSVVTAKSALGIKNAKVMISSPDGLADATYTLNEPTPLPKDIELVESGTLKLTFTVVDTEKGGILPDQAHLLFEDINGREDVTLPVNVKENGKASFTINTAKPHPALLPTSGKFHLTLLLSTLSPDTQPLQYPLGSLSLPPSILKAPARHRHDLPPRAGEPAFQAQQELFHTFQPDQKRVGVVKSGLGTGLVLAPWALLLALFGKISPQLKYTTPPTSTYLFLITLAGLEGLILTYWVGLRLYQFLPPFLALGLISAYTGKVALGAIRQERLKAGGTP